MPQPQVLVTSSQLSDAAKQILAAAGAQVSYMNDPKFTEDALIAHLSHGIEGVLLRTNPPFTRRVLEAAPKLKIIAKHGAGYDSVDVKAATERGIVVVTAGDANADPVAEHAVAVMLALARDLALLDRNLRGGKWEKGSYIGREFRGRRVGIVGYGEIGKRTARMAAALGAKIVVHTRSPVPPDQLPPGAEIEPSFEKLLGTVDIVSLHCPLNEKTRYLMNARTFALMQPHALFINTSRGGVVEEAALYQALKSGQIAGAAIDVFEQEPTNAKNPLFELQNLIVTPHTSAMTSDAMVRMGTSAASNIVGWLTRGECDTANVANPEVLKKQ